MNISKLIICIFFVGSLAGCKPQKWIISSESSTKIAIDNTTDKYADKYYQDWLQPFKQKIDAEMNLIIGTAAETMTGKAPESLLSNFSADVYLQAATNFLKQPVDVSIVNLGGLRTVVPKGDVTVRKVFELMPFENELVILWLKGDKLNDLLQFFASVGGEGESGIRMQIRDGKAIDIIINGQPLDMQKVYSIATSDYLAGGNDKMIQLAQSEKRLNTGLKLRNILLEYIKSETKKGNLIQSKLDGRITIN